MINYIYLTQNVIITLNFIRKGIKKLYFIVKIICIIYYLFNYLGLALRLF
jgi:hypothetical protein